jgi:hypothetical protein
LVVFEHPRTICALADRALASRLIVTEVYHRTAGGKVTYIDAMTRDEVEAAVKRAPHEWATSPRTFTKWPPTLLRGTPVIPASLADEARPSQSKVWDRT